MLPTDAILCFGDTENFICYTSMRKGEPLEKYNTSEIPKSSRITCLVDHLYAKMPEIESYRAERDHRVL